MWWTSECSKGQRKKKILVLLMMLRFFFALWHFRSLQLLNQRDEHLLLEKLFPVVFVIFITRVYFLNIFSLFFTFIVALLNGLLREHGKIKDALSLVNLYFVAATCYAVTALLLLILSLR